MKKFWSALLFKERYTVQGAVELSKHLCRVIFILKTITIQMGGHVWDEFKLRFSPMRGSYLRFLNVMINQNNDKRRS